MVLFFNKAFFMVVWLGYVVRKIKDTQDGFQPSSNHILNNLYGLSSLSFYQVGIKWVAPTSC